jgi:hypothetical protein
MGHFRGAEFVRQYDPVFSRSGKVPGRGPKGKDAVGLIATIQFLRANGMDKLVDAYGVHWYPPGGSATPADRLSQLRQVFAECGSVNGGGKPCWLTEWGLPVSSGSSYPVVDDKRLTIFFRIAK